MDIQSQGIDPRKLLTEQYKAYFDAKRQLVTKSFWEFSREVISWRDLYEPLHKPLCDFVQDNQDKKRLILLPRGHLKSSVVTVGYCLWKIAYNPKIRILIANATYPLAVTFLNQIKDHLMRNQKFIELFGNLHESSVKWSEDAITVRREESYDRKEPTVTVFGIGGSLTSQHYDLILLDDLVNRENIHTAERIEDVKTFYRDVVDLFDNPQTSEMIVIGTRWHEADLYGWLMEETNPASAEFIRMQRTAIEGEYEIIKKPQGGYSIEGNPKKYTFLFPHKFSKIGIEKLINDKGMSDFSAQYLNDPVPQSESTFKHEFNYYEEPDLKDQETNIYVTVDPAFFDPKSRNLETDYTVFMIVAVNQDNFWYIRDIIRERLQPKEIVDRLFDIDLVWHAKTYGIETTAFQKILSYYARERMREKNHFIPITELKHSGTNAQSKVERIQALEPRYGAGQIFHKKEIRHMHTLELELRYFPKGKHDDCIDALASMLEVAIPPRKRQYREGSVSRMISYPA